MAGFNRVAFRREVSPQLKNKAFPILAARVEGFFERKKEEAVQNFENHEVTRELESPSETSKFLPQGNLVGLLGYENVNDELNTVRDNLQESQITFLDKGRTDKDGGYTIKVRAQVPSIAKINEETELPWQSKGLIESIESGVSGFFRTLFGNNFDGSRSNEGIQVKTKVRDESFGGIGRGKYLGGILSDFARRLRRGPVTRD